MYEMMAQTRRAVPTGSICKTFSLIVALTGKAALGVWKKQRIATAAKPPTGKLI